MPPARHVHARRTAPLTVVSDAAVERAAGMFRALGDHARLRLVHALEPGERCVSELAAELGVKLSTLSQQLRVLLGERIVQRRRDGKHMYYTLADDHVRSLIREAIDHASEADA